jgi:N-acetylneuraminic acid mutarotase
MNDKMCVEMEGLDAGFMDRWIDASSARALVTLILQNNLSDSHSYSLPTHAYESTDGRIHMRINNIPSEIFTQFIPRFLHFDMPVSGMIYIFGGRASKVLEPEHYLDTAECYDTFRNEWIQLPPMSTKRVGAASVAASNGLIYILGGYSKHPDKPLATGECFNPRTGEWKSISPMARSRFGHTAQEFGKYIYVVGGDSRRNLVTEIERYDTECDIWDTVSMLPRPVAGGRILARNGKLYLVGGDIGSQPLSFTDSIRVFDPLSNGWSVLEDKLEMGRSACAVAWCGEGSSEIAVIGGYAAENDAFFELKTSEIIQTDTSKSKSSRIIPPLSEARAGCRAVTIGNKIYVVGGESPESSQKGDQMMQDPDSFEQSIVSGLFGGNVGTTSSQPLQHVRDMLLHALQQRLANVSASASVQDGDFPLRLPSARILPAPQTERRPHPTVAVFDTAKWEWLRDTPIMTTARTAASVCVGPGYSRSYGWNTESRWKTESRDSSLFVDHPGSSRRFKSASG